MNFKIGIITYHKVYNCGSSLQAYATLETFRKLGVKAEIINYVPDRFKNYGSFKQTYLEKKYFSNPLKAFITTIISISSRKRQRKQFDKFDKYLELGKEVFQKDLQNLNLYDVYFTGSDQVWNNYFGGFDSSYFLDFVKNGIPCFAYSASFGKTEFKANERREIKTLLSKYRKISVREDSGKRVLENIGFDTIQLLDPIYALSKDDWRKIANYKIKGKYILIYQISYKSDCIGYAKYLSNKLGNVPIYFIEYERRPHKRGINYVFCPTVNDFLGLFDNASYVVTDSFHGTSFSLKFNKQFFTILPPSFPGRLTSILNLIQLNSRVISNYTEIDNVIEENINWTYVNEILEKEANKNINFIKDCLNTVN